jgi:AcrR family transcriptional regulator
MDLIAKKADISKQTIYGYYHNKKDLFSDVILELIGEPLELAALNSQAKNQKEFEKSLESIAFTITNIIFTKEYIQLIRIIVSESTGHKKLIELYREQVILKSIVGITSFFESAKNKKFININNPMFTARMFVGGLLSWMLTDGLLIQASKVKKPTDNKIRAYVKEFLIYIKK